MGHHLDHDHTHPHTHSHDHGAPVGPAAGLRVPDAELTPADLRSDLPVHADNAARAARDAALGVDGRAVVYPGRDALVGDLSVAAVVASSAIDAVERVAGFEVTPETVVRTRDFARPVWRDGRLVLPLQPAAEGVVVPYETANPTPAAQTTDDLPGVVGSACCTKAGRSDYPR